MNFKNSIRSISLVLMAVALMSVTSVHQDAFAENIGMSVTATAAEGGNIISISGETTSDITDVTIRVISPNGSNVVTVDQVTPDSNGEFSTEFNVSNWKQDGLYEIKINQGTASGQFSSGTIVSSSSFLYTLTLYVDVTSGITAETSTTDSSIVTDTGVSPNIKFDYSDERGLWIEANAMEGSDTIEITGITSHATLTDVIFTVIAPNGNLVSVAQVTPDSNGDFATDISVGGPLWSQDGMYTVTAQQGDPMNGSIFTDSVEVDIADGLVVPEFGTIAAMILAVAIISIIAISAKSRLSIVPRY
jgi:predicted secreted protein with PEFG-CTERM motif